MSFTLKTIQQPHSVSKALKYDNLELTLCFKQNPQFERALSSVVNEMNKPVVLTKEHLTKSGGDITPHEALLFVLGEYAIAEWNVSDEQGNAVAINGDNFLLLCGQMPDIQGFLSWLFDEFTQLSQAYRDKLEDVKKKPLKAGVSKSSTKN